MGANELDRLQLNVGRWGNSLAVRLPAELARELGVTDGATLELQRNADADGYTLRARATGRRFARPAGRAGAPANLRSLPASTSVMTQLRQEARY